MKQEIPNPLAVDNYVKYSKSQLTIASDDTTKYECQLTFSAPPSFPFDYVAMNAPSFAASCFVSRW